MHIPPPFSLSRCREAGVKITLTSAANLLKSFYLQILSTVDTYPLNRKCSTSPSLTS